MNNLKDWLQSGILLQVTNLKISFTFLKSIREKSYLWICRVSNKSLCSMKSIQFNIISCCFSIASSKLYSGWRRSHVSWLIIGCLTFIEWTKVFLKNSYIPNLVSTRKNCVRHLKFPVCEAERRVHQILKSFSESAIYFHLLRLQLLNVVG